MVAGSPTLLLRQQAIPCGTNAERADPERFIEAVALCGALRPGFETDPAECGVADAFTRALELLEGGLAAYGSGT